MKVEIGAESAQFPGKEYINGIAVAVQYIKGQGHRRPPGQQVGCAGGEDRVGVGQI